MSYRRDDTDYPAAWLFAELARHFDKGQVFKDVDSIELGDDFAEVITGAVASCDVLLALIGRRWLTVTDQDGRRRLDNPDDFVRLEIEAALTRNVRVIPILVEAAGMPQAGELPPSLAKLARRQALELSPSRFGLDAQRLLRTLDRTLTQSPGRSRQQAGRTNRSRQQVELPGGAGRRAIPEGDPAVDDSGHGLSQPRIQAPGHLTGSASGTAAAPSTVQDNHVTALHDPGEDRTSRPLIGPVPSFEHSPGDGIVGGDVPKRTVPSPGRQETFRQGRRLTQPESSSNPNRQNNETGSRARRATKTDN